MNRLEGKSLDDEIRRYTEQLMSRYAQSTPPPPQPAPQGPNTGVTPAAPQGPNTGVTPAAPQGPNTGVTPAAPLPTQQVPVAQNPGPDAAPTQSPSSEVAPSTAYQLYLEQNPQRGILRVQTLTARSTYPVPGVKVVVSKMFPEGEYVIATQETDNAGKTEGLLLPAPDRSLSEQPGNGSHPFADYKVTVIHPNFATIVAMQLPVFAGESSVQILNLIPLAAAPHGSTTIEYITTEPSDL